MELNIYPNPDTKKTEITINSDSAGIRSAVLSDLSGNVIRQFELEEAALLNKFYVDRQQLPEGLYLLEVDTARGKKTVKIYIR